MKEIARRLDAYIQAHPFDSGDSDCETVLDQLYQAYAESHESDPEEIGDGFKEIYRTAWGENGDPERLYLDGYWG